MVRYAWIVAAALAAGMLVGCNQAMPGRSRALGTVEYSAAFAAAREVLAQYYSVESSDAETGVIQARPKRIDAPNERLLSGSPAREVATLRLRKEGKAVVAHTTVAVQRQGGPALQTMRGGTDTYSSVPDDTPAEREAATTVEQNESWRTHHYAHAVERKILDDLYRALHPKEAQP
jgi:hypothetical protein